ncbi:MAG: efflux RND transporter periplasmic adaptor subunit [Halieaceae bacterium]|nr:efflux RND transporter periplasmic adaptor subunit [Halieaceae bacterium]
MKKPQGANRRLATAAIAVVLAIPGCGDDRNADQTSTRFGDRSSGAPVVTAPVLLTDLNERLTSVGTARALKSVVIYAENSGRVTAVNIKADSLVAEAQTLLQLDDRDERLAVELATVQLADAERLVRRYITVNTQDMNIPESQLDDARAAVDAARIALAQAQVALDRRQIRAPFRGKVGITEVDVGDRIDTSTMVTTIDDRSVLLVNFSVPEVYVERVTRGTPVAVRLWDAADIAVQGEITAVDSRIDINSRSFIARAAIDNTEDQFRPGMAFEISVDASRGQYLSVPDVAVQWGADGAYVWVVAEGRAVRREIRLVKRIAGSILVEGELTEGESVVIEGVQAVRAGAALQVISTTALDAKQAPVTAGMTESSTNG